jgi:hypothetical protein
MKILIKITKDVLKRSAMCGIEKLYKGDSCAVALAIIDFLPYSSVGKNEVYPFYHSPINYYKLLPKYEDAIKLPSAAEEFISTFDALSPEQRIEMPEISFEIEVPDSVIQKIGIGQVYKVLSESKTMELVMN